jgi:hypothetical protein
MSDHAAPATRRGPDQPIIAFVRGCWILLTRVLVRLGILSGVFLAVLLVGYALDAGVWSVPLAIVATWLATLRYRL